MSRKKAHAGGHANSERWLLTYADLITLLLIYFIVLFAMSQIDVAKYHKLADAMSNAFNMIPSQGGSDDAILNGSPAVMPPVSPMYAYEKAKFETIRKQVEKAFKQAGVKGAVEIQQTDRGLVIHIASSALFHAGSADINPAMANVLLGVAKSLQGGANNIRVEGHTDDTPIRTAQFPSNWELSTTRAVNVLHFLIDRGHLPPSRLSAAGYGEYFPRVPN
ncbi:MAG: OmpA family protein, partial [Cyanobacteria bacterium REEB65]|nr:OmpA family protein [Cyanobacteria bacterium REEB65]